MLIAFLTLSLAGPAWSVQPSAPLPKPAPLRELPWGQLNFLHTTDTHGWHGGHLQEASFSADWGDYISFAHRLREKADETGRDILLVDTGDRVEGNGLYDASDPKGVYTSSIVKEQDIDIITVGNHELYKANTSKNEYDIIVPNFKGSYLASNLDIWDEKTGELKPFAPRFKKFSTKNLGINIVAFGFLFDFDGNAENTVVTPVKNVTEQDWFQDAIREKETDLFLVTGHVDIRSREFKDIFDAIRKVQWDTPIQFLGGHSHIRDFKKFDNKAVAMESGRYMETIGFASVSGLELSKKNNFDVARSKPKFKRRYIDNNLFSYRSHTGLSEREFPTAKGLNVSNQIAAARKQLNLDEKLGCAPKTLWLNRAPVNSDHSILCWLRDEVVPDQLATQDVNERPELVISNSGALRFDIYKGPFTRDATYLVSPFTSGFRYLQDVNYKIASKVIHLLNAGAPVFDELALTMNPAIYHPQNPDRLRESRHFDRSNSDQQVVLEDKNLTPGYTTKDDAGEDGDDTIHSTIRYYDVPAFIQSEMGISEKDETVEKVDLGYNEFIEPYVLLALKSLGVSYNETDTSCMLNCQSLNDIISDWVKDNWPCDDKEEL